MPKTPKKKKGGTAKKSSRTPRSIKKDIKAAAQSIPSLLTDRIDFANEPPPAQQQSPPPTPFGEVRRMPKHSSAYNVGKQRVLWTGVTAFTILVFGMWLWNARALIQNFHFGSSVEAAILEKTSANLQQTLNQASATEQVNEALNKEAEEVQKKRQMEEQLKFILAEELSVMVATSTDATTTDDVSV
jgi:hypothetical protein